LLGNHRKPDCNRILYGITLPETLCGQSLPDAAEVRLITTSAELGVVPIPDGCRSIEATGMPRLHARTGYFPGTEHERVTGVKELLSDGEKRGQFGGTQRAGLPGS
jgi:hypothetical protein